MQMLQQPFVLSQHPSKVRNQKYGSWVEAVWKTLWTFYVFLFYDTHAGAEELDLDGCGLNVRDAVMEKIFVVDTATTEAAKVGK